MRKSKMASTMGVVGGAPPEQAIVPPAAAAAAHAILPENNPVLQRLLSDDEMAAIKQQRMLESPARYRQHSHRDQVLRDVRRNNIDKAQQRKSREAKSAASRHKANGEAFKLGRAQPLTAQEEAELLGADITLFKPPTVEELGNLEDALNKAVDSDMLDKIEAAKPRNRKSLPTNPEGEAGGVGLVSNTLGANPRPITPKTKTRRAAAPVPVKLEQPSLEAMDEAASKATTRVPEKRTGKSKKASNK